MNNQGFLNIIGNYRKQQLFLFLIEVDFVGNLLELKGFASAEMICHTMQWEKSFGTRFLQALVGEGLLTKQKDLFASTELLEKYFSKKSKFYQGYNIRFENYLQKSWESLPEVLNLGRRVFSTDIKPEDKYKDDLERYIRAMDNVATIRAGELFDKLNLPVYGCLVDLAGGSGAFSYEFLDKHPAWHALHFDIPDVSDLAQRLLDEKVDWGHYSASIKNRIIYHTIDLSESIFPNDVQADCLLLSNIIHCYNNKWIEKLVKKSINLIKPNGLIVVHDFFNSEKGGAIYDIHMMLNTYEGKTYSKVEFSDIMENNGFALHESMDLPSQSSFMTYKFKKN